LGEIRVNTSAKGTDIDETVKRILDKLNDVIREYIPTPLRYFERRVPFESGRLRIELNKPVRVPYVVEFYDDQLWQIIDLHLYEYTVNKLAMRFKFASVYEVMLCCNSSGSTRTISSDVVGGFAFFYLTVSEFREAIREAYIFSRRTEVVEWFRQFINTLEIVSASEVSVIDRKDLYEYGDPPEFAVHIIRPTKRVDSISLRINISELEDIKLTIRAVLGSEKRRERDIRVTYQKYGSRYTLNIYGDDKMDAEVIAEVLHAVAENDRMFHEVRKRLATFLEVYAKTLLAFKLIEI